MFALEDRDLKRLWLFYMRQPKRFAVATGMMLNNFAFGVRDTIVKDVLPSRMVVRSPRFVQSRVRVSKSHFREPIASQESRVGSIASKRFTGWIEQEGGASSLRTRTAHLLSRKGDRKGLHKSPFRMKRTNDFEDPDDTKVKGASTPHTRAVVMIQMISRRKGRKKPFMIHGHKNMKSGLYKIGRGRRGKQKIQMLQRFDSPKARSIKRVRWMKISRTVYFSRLNLRSMWVKVLNKLFDKPR